MEEISIVECAPIDGFKMLGRDVSLMEKANFIDKLSETGITHIQAASFIHPKLMHQLGDAEQLTKSIKKNSDVTYIGLTPNEIACRRAILTDIDEVLIMVAASETFNHVTTGHSLRETMNKILPSIIHIALNEGKSVRVYILAAFGCPYEGKISISKVTELVSKLDFMRVNEISLSDTPGLATPMFAKEVISTLLQMEINARLAVHFHDTRGMAIANAFTAFEQGIKIFDTAVGGMSTKPFGIPNQQVTSWNIPTEDLVNMFESMGIKTGIDLDLLLGCASMAEKMLKRQLSGHIIRAGANNKIFKPPQRLKIR